MKDINIFQEIQPTDGPDVAVVNGGIMRSTNKVTLPLSGQLSKKTKLAFSFEELQLDHVYQSGNYVMMIASPFFLIRCENPET